MCTVMAADLASPQKVVLTSELPAEAGPCHGFQAPAPAQTRSSQELPSDESGNLWHLSPPCALPMPGLTHWSLGLADKPRPWLPMLSMAKVKYHIPGGCRRL